MTRFARTLVVAALLPLAALQPAHAQFGGLIKKKVKEAIKSPEKTPGDQKPKAAGSNAAAMHAGFNADVLEITEPVFTRLIHGIETELRLQGEFRQMLAKFPTQEQYDQCLAKAVQGPEYAKIMEALTKTPQNATPEQVMAAQTKMATDLEALAKKFCPVKPATTEWPNGRRMEKLEEIRAKAADTAGRDTTVTVTGSGGTSPGGWTVTQYARAIERADRLCDYNSDPAGSTVVPDTLQKRDSTQNDLMITGTGIKIYWVFTPRETTVLNSANCSRFKALSKRLM